MTKYSHLTPANVPVVIVAWEDIIFDDNYTEDDADLDSPELATLAWLLDEVPNKIVVGSTYNYKEDDWHTMHCFTKVMPMATRYMLVKETIGEQPEGKIT